MTRMGQAGADNDEEDGSGRTIMKRKTGAAGGEEGKPGGGKGQGGGGH